MMALFERAIQRGLHADRPAPGAPGACYFETDTGNGYRDSGTTWDLITGAPPEVGMPWSVHTPTANYAVPQGNTLIIIGADDIVITLPDQSVNTGFMVAVLTDGRPYSVHNPDSSDAPHSGVSPALYISDGTTWWTMFGFWA